MEREKMVKSVMSGQPASTPATATTPAKPVSTPVMTGTPVPDSANKLTNSERVRATPKMKIFQGSQTPVRTRPVSLFVHGSDVTNNRERTGLLGRSQSMRKPLESSPPVVQQASPVQSSPDNGPVHNFIPGRFFLFQELIFPEFRARGSFL